MLAKAIAILGALSLVTAAPFEGRKLPARSFSPVKPRAAADKPVVAAYYTEWSAYGREYFLDDVPYGDLTHLLYAFMWVSENGTVASGDPAISFGMEEDAAKAYLEEVGPIPKAPKSKHPVLSPAPDILRPEPPAGTGSEDAKGLAWFGKNPDKVGDTQILLSLGGYTWSKHFPTVIADETKRKTFVDSAKALVDEYGLHGVDCDYEYPGTSDPDSGVVGSTSDKDNFVLLVKELREAMPDKLITAAVAVSPEKQDAGYSSELGDLFDLTFVMAYDVMGPWEKTYAAGSPLAGSSPFSGRNSIDNLVKIGFKKETLVLGLPGYGRMVKTEGSNAIGTPATSDMVKGTWDDEESGATSTFDYWHIGALKKQTDTWQHCFDEETASSTLWNEKESLIITYDCKHAVQAKKKWADEQGIAGLMLWEVSADRSDKPGTAGEFVRFMNGETDPNPVHACGASSGGSASASAGSGDGSDAALTSVGAGGASVTTGPLTKVTTSLAANAAASGAAGGAAGDSVPDAAGKEASDAATPEATSGSTGSDPVDMASESGSVAESGSTSESDAISGSGSASDTSDSGSDAVTPSSTTSSETPDPAAGASSPSSESCEGGTYRCNDGKIEQCASTWMTTGWVCGDSCTGDATFTCQGGVLAQCVGGQALPSSGAKCAA